MERKTHKEIDLETRYNLLERSINSEHSSGSINELSKEVFLYPDIISRKLYKSALSRSSIRKNYQGSSKEQSTNNTNIQSDLFRKRVLAYYSGVRQRRKAPNKQLDQCFATPSTILKRITFLHTKGDLRDKEIVLLGDDDLMSLALALTKLPRKITVLEKDAGIIELIRSEARLLRINSRIELIQYDVAEAPSKNYKFRFDLAFTDPPYTLDGITVFVSRCMEMLKSGPWKVCYVNFSLMDSTLETYRCLLKELSSMGLVILDCLSNFNEYYFRRDMLDRDFVSSNGTKQDVYFSSSLLRCVTACERRINEITSGQLRGLYNYEEE